VQDYFWIKGHERKKFNLDAFESVPREHGQEAFYGRQNVCAPFFYEFVIFGPHGVRSTSRPICANGAYAKL
jgi:hypothetical protein